jgi:hypothetical protein
MATHRAIDAARQLKDDIKNSMRISSRSKERTALDASSTITNSDSTDNNSTSSSTLHVPGSSIRSNSPNSTIATLISVPSAPQLTADTHHLNNSIKSETDNQSNPLITTSMQNPANSTNVSAISSGIIPPPVQCQQPLHMQSTTPSVANGKDEMRGWLYKWTNYLKGYQKRWFVLQAGILSYYRSQDEMTHTCRGTVYLEAAHLSSNDACHFVISNGSTIIHLRTSTEIDKQRWMSALELAKQKALKARKQYQDSDEDVSTTEDSADQLQNLLQQQTNINDQTKGSINSNERAEIATMNKTFDAKLEDLKMCMDLINRHYQALHRTLADLEQIDKSETTINIIKSVNERATLFRITSTAMVNACQELVQLIHNQGRKWQKAFQFERDARLRMERMCEQVASQSAKLEKQMQRASRIDKQSLAPGRSTLTSIKSSDLRGTNESDDDEFYDAIDDPQTIGVFRVPLQQHLSNNDKESPNIVADDVSSCDDDTSESEEQDEDQLPMVIVKASKKEETTNNAAPSTETNTVQTAPKSATNTQQQQQQVAIPKHKRRDRIPERPNYSINLWSIMKNCVGKDLSKIPIPVNFSEPISMLQRMTEELEYSSVLDMAAKTNDSWEQLAYVAAFTISSYSTTATRVNKPFNPLLGETYECDRTDDLGWKSIAEQVSHHPPALSTYAEGQGWTLYQEFTMTSKFRGQYLSITPLGHSHLIFKNTGNHFTWRKVTTLVNNIIVGKLWIDNVGEMDIINHTTKDVCKLKYFPYSYFSKDVPRKVTGVVTDVNGQARWVLTGTWTEKIEGGPVESTSGRHAQSHHMETRNMKLLWQRKMPPAYLENMYNFTQLAVELNEDEPGVAPTDSRRRPDQRLMEEGRWDEANQEKLRLEEKQRQNRRAREAEGHDIYKSKWFKKQHDTFTDSEMHSYTNEYWECKQKQDWSRCDDIF